MTLPGYKPCDGNPPTGDHSFTGEDDRCFWCDAKPWYVSIRADHPDGEPVSPAASFMSFAAYATEKAAAIAPMERYDCLTCLDIGFVSHSFDSSERCPSNCEAARLLWSIDVAEDRDLYATPA